MVISARSGGERAGSSDSPIREAPRESGAQITMRTARIAFAALFAAAMLQGCGDDKAGITNPITNPTSTQTLTAVHVSPATLELEEGETFQLDATPVDQAGKAMEGIGVVWRSADEAVATVDPYGLVTAVLEGQVEILVDAEDGGATVTGKSALSVVPTGNVIPVSGGTVSYLNGAVVLEIPDGALAEATKITIRPSAAEVAAEQPDMVGGTAYYFRPEGLRFQTAAQLTVQYEPGNVPADVLQERLSLYHRTENGWTEVEASQVDAMAHTVTGPVESFSHYGVRESGRAEVARVDISGATSEPLGIGATLQLTATLRDASGNVLDGPRWQVVWTSSDNAVATVDGTGLVTGMAHGKATVMATSELVSGTVDLNIAGEPIGEEGGNNLSWPVVFADGVGLTGLPVSEDAGVRPTLESGITVDSLPFFWEGNVPDYGVYYMQGGTNTWRAEIIDGTDQTPYEASAYWGDNLTGSEKEWKVGDKIRVEVALSATGVGTLRGFSMPLVLYPASPEEQQGTDGTTLDLVPLIYTEGSKLIVAVLDEGGNAFGAIAEEPIGSEVNVAGRIVYGHQLEFEYEGWYRLSFVLASGSNVRLTAVGSPGGTIVSPTETALDIHIVAN